MTKSPPPKEIEQRLISILKEFLIELGSERAVHAISLNASIERDLGIDSLGRVELFHRFEKAFGLQFSETTIGEAETLQDILNALEQAHPRQQLATQQSFTPLKKIKVDIDDASTLPEVLLRYAKAAPDRPHIYLQDETGTETLLTYGELLSKATKIAIGLVNKGLKPGETVAIMLPTSIEFFAAFFGVQLVGAIPVPIYPPFRSDRIEEYATREASILRNAEVRFLITFHAVEALSKLLKNFIPSLIEVVTVSKLSIFEGELPKIAFNKDDFGLIQYTSGSTGLPKGVLLTQSNLLANIRAAGEAIDVRPTDIVVSWLPLYHDMGLIGAWLGSLYHGLPLIIMSPLLFLARPERWLWAIHYHRCTISAAPNFAYELCVRKIDEYLLEGLDLSSWRIAFNGAEAVQAKTLEHFSKKFANYGFDAKALFPVYGLAESAVALLFPPVGRGIKIDYIHRSDLETKQQATPCTTPNEKNCLEFVACGKPIADHAVRIVNEEGMAVGEREIGELEFTGPSSMQGYYRNHEATQHVFHEGWWATGDLAYQAEGEIYITGRKKDLIIKAGHNIYPEEIEAITAQINGVRKGCVAAFGVTDTNTGTEKLIIVAETRKQTAAAKAEISQQIIEKVVSATGIIPDHIVCVSARVIPKTSSGKLRRSATKEAYLQGYLSNTVMPAWLQIIKLVIASSRKKIHQWLNTMGRVLYSGYVGLVLLLTVPPIWLATLALPPTQSIKWIHYWGRLFLWLVGCRLKIDKENWQHTTPTIYVANHASYSDIIALIAAIPTPIYFVAKQELLQTPIIKTFIRKHGHITLNRLDFTESLNEMRQITDALAAGHSVLIFPEGTFAYASGLRPFKLGAFKIAMETNTAICPVAIQGTRQLLRSGSFFPRPNKITVTFCKAIVPQENSWQEVLRLRSLARIEIARHCGEYPIDLVSSEIPSI